MPTIWYLQITSWSGIVGWAKHFYGTFEPARGGDYLQEVKRVHVEHPMSREEAEEESDRDDFKYKPGYITVKFWNREQVIECAIEQWQKIAAEGDALILGDAGVCEPQKALAGPAEFVEQMNELFDESESYGWDRWADHREEMNVIEKKWDALVEGWVH
jgi:hypothetical protein